MWSNQENRVRKQVKNPCEARKIKASQNLHKIISTHLLTWLKVACYIISRTKEDREKGNELLNPPNVLTTTAKAAYINCEIFSQKATKLVSIERRNDL